MDSSAYFEISMFVLDNFISKNARAFFVKTSYNEKRNIFIFYTEVLKKVSTR